MRKAVFRVSDQVQQSGLPNHSKKETDYSHCSINVEKNKASSHFLCVGPSQITQRQDFSRHGSFVVMVLDNLLLQEGKPLYEKITTCMQELIGLRSQLVSKKLSKDETKDVKNVAVSLIDWGNGLVSLTSRSISLME